MVVSILLACFNDISLRAGISNSTARPNTKIDATYSPLTKQRIIDLDGFVASRGEKHSFAPGVELNPGSSEITIPLYNNEEVIFDYESLVGAGLLPDFGLMFEATIAVSDFQHQGGANTLTFKLKAKEVSSPTEYSLLTFNLKTNGIPSSGVTTFSGVCCISGQLGCQAQKNIVSSGKAYLSGAANQIFPGTTVYESDTFKCSTGGLNVNSILDNDTSLELFFTASSTDTGATLSLNMLNCFFRLFRRS